MKKTLTKVLWISAALFLAAAAFSCNQTAGEAVWYNDFEESKAAAAEQDKNILLFFTGSDWDTISQSLAANVFTSDVFLKKVASEYILTQLDFPQAEGSIVEEQFMKNYDVANSFTLEGIPTVLLVTKEGYVIAVIETTADIESADDYVKTITSFNKQSDKIVAATKKMDKAEGLDKVKHIDTFADLLDPSYRYLLSDLFSQITDLDPENKSNLYGKYLLQLTYPKAMETFASGSPEEAIKMFIDIAEGGLLNTADTQEAYYSAASLSAQTPDSNSEVVLDYLRKSYTIDTESKTAESILTTIEYIESSIAAEKAAEDSLVEEANLE
jgi:thioredoxin-related protein